MYSANFIHAILRLLPQNWRRSFRADEALEVFDLNDFIGMTYRIMKEKKIQAIMELCIISSHPDDWEYDGGNPYAVLYEFNHLSAKFDGKMYELACSNQCKDSERIIKLFCDKPAKKIQNAWKGYKHNQVVVATRLIQQKVLKCLYRPGGPMMKKAKTHFYTIPK